MHSLAVPDRRMTAANVHSHPILSVSMYECGKDCRSESPLARCGGSEPYLARVHGPPEEPRDLDLLRRECRIL